MRKISLLLPALLLAACTPAPQPVAIASPPAPTSAHTAPVPLTTPEPVADTAVTAAKRNLKTLGYDPGKVDASADTAFQKAIQAFQKDQGLTANGRFTSAVAERLKQAAAALTKAASVPRNAVFVYSDGSVRKEALGLLPLPPAGLTADAPDNFLLPLRPGTDASYNLSHGGTNPVTVACHVGRITPATAPLSASDAMTMACDGGAVHDRAVYNLKLGLVVKQAGSGGTRDLVAIRPSTDDWPLAARTGLDWALTHALETPSGAPIAWSSTAVTPHFDISAGAKLSGREAGLTGRYAALPCRRFEIIQNGPAAASYPGIACLIAAGTWSLPGSKTPLAHPASGIAAASHAPQNAR